MTIQLIDENKAFNTDDFPHYLQSVNLANNGLNYHVVSVFGSQSTGKSTLLNALFGTDFNVMSESARQQTTKGIWLAKADTTPGTPTSEGSSASSSSYVDVQKSAKADSSPDSSSPILVMDVEGTDGRERGEDQDFERKSALFALATSEVLIVNMWENQVGLYQGANMGLLKTVFEVNLSLFHASKQTPRSLILFVIRDHIGTTPLDNLSQTLMADLNKHWESISKPTEDLKHSKIEDFFDIQFHALPHKILLPDQFSQQVQSLSVRFSNPASSDYVFKPEYHRKVPIDGWNMYTAKIWEQIELNKDLDLPTQQVLVARFRCGEIATQAMEEFEAEFRTRQADTGGLLGDAKVVIPDFHTHISALRSVAVELYDKSASRYVQSVYLGQRKDLQAQVDSRLVTLYKPQLAALHSTALTKLQTTMEQSDLPFSDRVETARKQAIKDFESGAQSVADIDPEVFGFESELAAFSKDLDLLVQKYKDEEIDRLVTRASKRIAKQLDEDLDSVMSSASPTLWDDVLEQFNKCTSAALGQYKSGSPEGGYDFNVGASADANKRGADKVMRNAWLALDSKLKQLTSTVNIVAILQDKFDLDFKYDKEKVPIVWKPGDDIQTPFVKARDDALKLVPLFKVAKLSSGKVITPDVKIFDDEDDDEREFANRLTNRQVEEIETKFNRQAELAFVEAKRSTYQSITHVPAYMIILLVILGWNEFMAVLRNPFLFLFVLMIGAGAYITFSLNMWGPIISVTGAMTDRAIEIGKEKLRQALEVDPNQRATRQGAQGEAIEMNTFSMPGGGAFSSVQSSPATEEEKKVEPEH
uniref:ARAD1C23606p n=1 Tax=Blastobotrys adeninivorans TaxID=409370 RepID=A0A060T1C3_BLAAD